MLLYSGIDVLEKESRSLYIQIILLVVFVGAALVRAGTVVKNPLYGYLALPVLVFALAVCAVYNFVFPMLLVARNEFKALFVAVINPAIFEVVIVLCRFIARSHRHNHPLTSCMTVAIAMTLKKMYGRYVAATITRTSYVVACGAFLGLVEYLSVTTLPARDRFFYDKCGALGRACLGATKHLDPQAQMNNPRNRELRVHSAVMETSLEIVFSWTGVVLVIWYDVSADRVPINRMTVVTNGAVQYAIEMLVDLACILHLTVLQKVPYLDYANSRYWGWSFTTGVLTFFASVAVCPLPASWHLAFLPTPAFPVSRRDTASQARSPGCSAGCQDGTSPPGSIAICTRRPSPTDG